MSESTSPRPEQESATLQLELGGRRFPESWSAPGESRLTPPRRIVEAPADAQLPSRLREILWERLVWNSHSLEEADTPTLVRTYIDSLNQLHEFQCDIEELVKAACRANLEFRRESGPTHEPQRDAAMKAKLQEMFQEAAHDWLPPENLVGGELNSQSPMIVRSRLHDSLQKSVHRLVMDFFELLAKLVDRELFGLVEWFPNHCCDYHFFKRVIIQEEADVHEEIQETQFDWSEVRHTGRGTEHIGQRKVVIRDTGTHVHRCARHVHSVINAVRTSIGNSRVVMPLAVTETLKAVPEWLYPFVEVIDGEIVRERIIERDTGVEHWDKTTIVRDDPVYGPEPAVLIGPYVLTGWGPREIAAEESRRAAANAEKSQQAAQWRGPLSTGAAIVLAPLTLLFLIQGSVLAFLMSAVAAISAGRQAVQESKIAKGGRAATTPAETDRT